MWALLRDAKFRHATVVLIGTMIGVGIYGVPFAFAKAGFWVGTVWLVIVVALMALVYLLLAELTLSTQGTHQLAGYARIWLGEWGRSAMMFTQLLTIYGALLAYLIVFGEFAHTIFSRFISVDPQLYSWLFAAVWSVVWLVRLRAMALVETGLIVLYGALIVLIVGIAGPHAHLANLTTFEPSFWFLPYGILLFALGGATAIPLQRQLVAGRERLMRPAIITALAVTGIAYLLFAVAVVGVSGDITSPEALAGLFGLVPGTVIVLGALFGMVTISTSYIALGTALYESFRWDYKLRLPTAWLLTIAPPLVFFWLGLRNFIDVIGIAGAVAGGLQGVLLLAAYLRARHIRLRQPEFRVRIPAWMVWLLMLVFAAGVGYELLLR